MPKKKKAIKKDQNMNAKILIEVDGNNCKAKIEGSPIGIVFALATIIEQISEAEDKSESEVLAKVIAALLVKKMK